MLRIEWYKIATLEHWELDFENSMSNVEIWISRIQRRESIVEKRVLALSIRHFRPFVQGRNCGLELEQGAQVPNTEEHMRLRLYPYTRTHTIMHTQAYNHRSDNHAQWHLPPQQKAFVNTTNGFCQHHQRHLPTHSKALAPTTNGIHLHNARHLPFHNHIHIPPGKSQSSAAKSQKNESTAGPFGVHARPLGNFWYDLSSSAIDVLETELFQ